MARLPDQRNGKHLKIKSQQIEFSFWPVQKGSRRYGLQPRVFISDPWGIIRHSIETNCIGTVKTAALAFCEQAEDFFRAASVSGIVAAKPILLYYSMLNISKAFVLLKRIQPIYADKAFHGLSEHIHPNGQELIDSLLCATPSGRNVNVFDDFLKSLNNGVGLPTVTNYKMEYLLPQIIQAHRLWCSSTNKEERLIPIYRIDLMQNSNEKTLWTNLLVYEDELNAKSISHRLFLDEACLSFQEVKCNEDVNGRKLICFEQLNTIRYSHRPSDNVPELILTIKNNLWSSVLSVPPYRKYYAYLSPPSELNHRLPQLGSIFAIFFYFGSITRYRPYNFEKILSGTYGGHIRELIETVPNQFLYLLASEFCQQEISKASIL